MAKFLDFETITKNSYGWFNCPYETCDQSTSRSIKDLKSHYLTHFKENCPISCSLCQITFTAISNAISHAKTFHSLSDPEGIIKCDDNRNNEIRAKFASARINILPQTNVRRDHICDQCQSAFSEKGQLNAHKKQVHSKGLLKCPIGECTSEYKTKANLIRHVNSFHSEAEKSAYFEQENVKPEFQLQSIEPSTKWEVKSISEYSHVIRDFIKKFDSYDAFAKKAIEIEKKMKMQLAAIPENSSSKEKEDKYWSVLYLLQDPDVLQDILLLNYSQPELSMELFELFILAIYYCGKGGPQRPYDHDEDDDNVSVCRILYSLTVY